MTNEEFQAEYVRLGHAIQSAEAFRINRRLGEHNVTRELKHVRAGLNVTMRDHSSLVRLLVDKGIITDQESKKAIIEGLVEELEFVSASVREEFGLPDNVTFG